MRGEAEGRGHRAVLCLRCLLPAPLEAPATQPRRPALVPVARPPVAQNRPPRCPARPSQRGLEAQPLPPPGSASAARQKGRPGDSGIATWSGAGPHCWGVRPWGPDRRASPESVVMLCYWALRAALGVVNFKSEFVSLLVLCDRCP
ncbi:hypothetical protein NN561_003376 [Cricetulus griseus]